MVSASSGQGQIPLVPSLNRKHTPGLRAPQPSVCIKAPSGLLHLFPPLFERAKIPSVTCSYRAGVDPASRSYRFKHTHKVIIIQTNRVGYFRIKLYC